MSWAYKQHTFNMSKNLPMAPKSSGHTRSVLWKFQPRLFLVHGVNLPHSDDSPRASFYSCEVVVAILRSLQFSTVRSVKYIESKGFIISCIPIFDIGYRLIWSGDLVAAIVRSFQFLTVRSFCKWVESNHFVYSGISAMTILPQYTWKSWCMQLSKGKHSQQYVKSSPACLSVVSTAWNVPSSRQKRG